MVAEMSTEREIKIEYGFVSPEDYPILEPIFKAYGGQVPDPTISRIAIASFNGEIIGFYCLQLIAHAEPMWIKPEFRGSRVNIKLAKMIDDLREDKKTYIVCDNDESESLCMAAGMKRVLKPVFVVEGEL